MTAINRARHYPKATWIGAGVLAIAISAVVVSNLVVKEERNKQVLADMEQFSRATELLLQENPTVSSAGNKDEAAFGSMKSSYIKAMNGILPQGYKIENAIEENSDPTENITVSNSESAVVYQSICTDPWGTPYFIIFDAADRHADGNNDFYITVVSAGPNRATDLNGTIDSDDIFMLSQYQNGDTNSVVYRVSEDRIYTYAEAEDSIVVLQLGAGQFSGKHNAPVNF